MAPGAPPRGLRPRGGARGANQLRHVPPVHNRGAGHGGQRLPLATPTTNRRSRAHNSTSGGSFDIEACLTTNLNAMMEQKARRDKRNMPGNILKCLVASCGPDYPSGGKFCNHCGANQDIKEVNRLKMISDNIKGA